MGGQPRSQQEHCCGGCSSTQLSSSTGQRSSGGYPCPDKLTQLSCDSPCWLGFHINSWNPSFIECWPDYPHVSLVIGILWRWPIPINPVWLKHGARAPFCWISIVWCSWQHRPMCERMSSTWSREKREQHRHCLKLLSQKLKKYFEPTDLYLSVLCMAWLGCWSDLMGFDLMAGGLSHHQPTTWNGWE